MRPISRNIKHNLFVWLTQIVVENRTLLLKIYAMDGLYIIYTIFEYLYKLIISKLTKLVLKMEWLYTLQIIIYN